MGPWDLRISLAVAAAGWIAGFAVLGRMRYVVAPKGRPEPPRRLSIIIPARNEALRLPRLLESIARQPERPEEIIVVDDNSSDGTAEAARKCAGVRVIPAGALPDGWRGKTWACHVGAGAARGDLLLFIDADVWFEPNGLGRILKCFGNGLGALSIAPFHAVRQSFEQFSAYFNLIMVAGVGASRMLGGPSGGLFGQLLLIDRAVYEKIGGHTLVRDQVLENLRLSAALQKEGIAYRSLVGRGVVSMRMYPEGFRSVVRGWQKAFAGGARSVSAMTLFGIVLWLSGAVSASALLPAAILTSNGLMSMTVGAAVGIYVAFVAQLAWFLRGVGSFRLITSALYPVFLGFFFCAFASSAVALRLGRPVQWKGRSINAG